MGGRGWGEVTWGMEINRVHNVTVRHNKMIPCVAKVFIFCLFCRPI